MDKGNRFLKEQFIADYNRRFSVKAEGAQEAWRTISRNGDMKRAISFRYQAVVGNDNAVRVEGMVIAIPEGPQPRGYAKAKVEIRQLLDGSRRVYSKDALIAHTDPTPLREPIRAKPRRRPRVRAPSEEKWVYLPSAVERGHVY